MSPLVAGWLALGIPLLVFGLFFLSRMRPVLLMYLFACMVGMGYLTATGALEDLGGKLIGYAASDASKPAATTAPMPSEYPSK